MNIAIILAGGTGTRLGTDIPKQYIVVGNEPVFMYCLRAFQVHRQVDKIVIVAAHEWQNFIQEWIQKKQIDKFASFAIPGKSRQHSILSGLKEARRIGDEAVDNIIIHDAARPFLSEKMIEDCINGLEKYDDILPVLPVKDTMYLSADGFSITSLLNRDHIYIGQSPESFRLNAYYKANISTSDEYLNGIRGSSEIAYKAGMSIGLISGDERNYKITTRADLDKFETDIKVGCKK